MLKAAEVKAALERLRLELSASEDLRNKRWVAEDRATLADYALAAEPVMERMAEALRACVTENIDTPGYVIREARAALAAYDAMKPPS